MHDIAYSNKQQGKPGLWHTDGAWRPRGITPNTVPDIVCPRDNEWTGERS